MPLYDTSMKPPSAGRSGGVEAGELIERAVVVDIEVVPGGSGRSAERLSLGGTSPCPGVMAVLQPRTFS